MEISECENIKRNNQIIINNVTLKSKDEKIRFNSYLKNHFKDEHIVFNNCNFDDILELYFDNYHSENKKKVITVHFNKCIFIKKLSLINSVVEYDLIFHNCIFIENVDISSSYFSEYVDFSNSIFISNLNLEFCTFDNKATFKNTTFNKSFEFNLEDTYLNDGLNFFNINSKKLDLPLKEHLNFECIDNIKKEELNVKNRETARIIKDSFEQQNNIIEANKFYALEMKKRDMELKWKDDFLEKLIFSFHKYSSKHSQNWFYPLIWILTISFFTQGIEVINDKFDDYPNLVVWHTYNFIFMYIVYFLLDHDIKINSFFKLIYINFIQVGYISFISNYTYLEIYNFLSEKVNPFSIMTESSKLDFFDFIYKIIIAYLIYQLIISIRQNTRRK